jgi:hypothetical protein
VADKEYFLGIINRDAIESALVDGRKEQPLASLVESLHVPHTHTDQPLHLALERMSKYHLDVLPVVHRADIHKLEGVVTMFDVLNVYGIDYFRSQYEDARVTHPSKLRAAILVPVFAAIAAIKTVRNVRDSFANTDKQRSPALAGRLPIIVRAASQQLLRMRFFNVGNAVPNDSPRSIALTLELCNEIRLMGHQHTCATVVFVIGATVDCQVPATRNIYSLVNETDFPKWVVSKASLEALSVGFDSNSWGAATFHGDDIRGVKGCCLDCIVGIDPGDDLSDVRFDCFGNRRFVCRQFCGP